MIAMNIRQSAQQAHTGAPRRLGVRLCLPAVVLVAALMTAPAPTSGRGEIRARSARNLNVTDTAHLHFVKEAKAELIDEGTATGTVPGNVKVSFDISATVEANFTIDAHDGSIIGHGAGTLHQNAKKSDIYVSFAGTMTVSHGTGRYAKAHGTGGFYGVVDRKNYAVTIQTTGTLSY
jgi:hypothetical protein